MAAMVHARVTLCVFLSLVSLARGHTEVHECSTFEECKNSVITCADYRPCIIYCLANNTCQSSVIACSSDWDCSVVCQGDMACLNAKISGPSSCGATLAVTIGSQGEVYQSTAQGMVIDMRNTDIAKIKIYNEDSDSSVNREVAEGITIFANNANNVSLYVEGYNALANGTFYGSNKGAIDISAHGAYAMFNNSFDFYNSSRVTITCADGSYACSSNTLYARDATGNLVIESSNGNGLYDNKIYCPNNGPAGDPTCRLVTSGATTIAHSSQNDFYALEGLNDLTFDCLDSYTDLCVSDSWVICGRWYSSKSEKIEEYDENQKCDPYNTIVNGSTTWKCGNNTYCENFIMEDSYGTGEDDSLSASEWYWTIFYDNVFAWVIAAFLYIIWGIIFVCWCYALWRRNTTGTKAMKNLSREEQQELIKKMQEQND